MSGRCVEFTLRSTTSGSGSGRRRPGRVRRDWVLTVQFLDVPERDQDVIRAHVFAVLRRERARGVL